MRKSVVFVLVLATMFLLGTSNAGAGNGPAFFTCSCDSFCEDGVPVGGFIAEVEYLGDFIVPSQVEITSVDVMYDGMIEPLTPVDPPPPVILPPGGTAMFVTLAPMPMSLPPGENAIECIGQYSYLNGTIDGIVPLNNGGEFRYPGTCFVPTCSLQVYVDIRPQSCPNPLNLNAKGVQPVAILGTDDFDVTQVDPASILLAGVAPLRWSLRDVATPFNGIEINGCSACTEDGADGNMDLTLKFNAQEIVAALADSEECPLFVLTGNLKAEYGGTPIQGYDTMWVTPSVDGE